MAHVASERRSLWRLPALLVLLSLVPAVAGIARLLQLSGGAAVTAENARFFAHPLPVVLHILSVIPFSVLGAFQLVPRLTRSRSRWHRIAGRALAPLGLLAAGTGIWMAQFYPWPAGDGDALYVMRLLFGAAMFVSIVLALGAVRRRDFVSHGAWMIRAYAIGLGAGTQVLTHLPWFILFGPPGELPRAVLMGAGWLINVAIAEWAIARIRSTARAPSSVSPSSPIPLLPPLHR